MTAKDDLYRSYVSSHTAHRKAVASPTVLAHAARTFDARLRNYLPKDLQAPIVDVGCGDGRLVWWLHQAGYANALGVDVSQEQLAAGRAAGVTGLHHGDAIEFLSSRGGDLSLVFLRDVLEHFTLDDGQEALQAAYESLRSDGRVVIQVPNATSPWAARVRYGDATHERSFTEASLYQQLTAAGFTSIRFQAVRPLPLGPSSTARYYAWRCLEMIYGGLLAIELGRGRRIVTQNLICSARR